MNIAAQDIHGQAILPGDLVRILGITADPDLDEDDLDLILDMVGSTCAVERVDADGLAWVSVWWNDFGRTFPTSVALDAGQMEKVPA